MFSIIEWKECAQGYGLHLAQLKIYLRTLAKLLYGFLVQFLGNFLFNNEFFSRLWWLGYCTKSVLFFMLTVFRLGLISSKSEQCLCKSNFLQIYIKWSLAVAQWQVGGFIKPAESIMHLGNCFCFSNAFHKRCICRYFYFIVPIFHPVYMI